MNRTVLALPFALALAACTSMTTYLEFRAEPFGEADGARTTRYTLTNSNGVVAVISDLGATLVELHVPDRDGELADVVLGFDDAAGYLSEANQYFGCTVGRCANRVGEASFVLDGERHDLAANDGDHQLHGGPDGFHRRVWELVATTVGDDEVGLRFKLTSPHGDQGYPGAVDVEVAYALTNDDELRIEYHATCERPTIVNLTHHSYFNLAGHGSPTVLDHVLRIDADEVTAGDAGMIPRGERVDVSGTPLDFRRPTRLGERIAPLDDAPSIGYDHNYVLANADGELRFAARLEEPTSGRAMEIWTTEDGLQLYSGNFLFGQTGKGGATYAHRSAMCLEAQAFPNAANVESFPSVVLRPGDDYTQTTVHRFSAD